jgi:hypothetical protein
MPYLTLHGSSTLIGSHIPTVGEEVVDSFSRSWTLTEIDSIAFRVIAPKTPIVAGQKYDIWGDANRSMKLATCYVLSPGTETIHGHPKTASNQEIVVFNPNAVGPTFFLKKKRINVTQSNIKISDLAKLIIDKIGAQYGISSDYSYVQDIKQTLNVDYKAMTAYDIFERLREFGISYYVDDDFRFHFFETEGEIIGHLWDDNTSYLNHPLSLAEDISELRNAVQIIGADKVKQAPTLTIVGTGDLTTGLDFNLPHNVKFSDDLILEDWQSIEPSLWEVSDPKGSTSPLSPDGSRIFLGNSSVHFDGGNGVQGPTVIVAASPLERTAGIAILQTMSFGNFGEGFIFAYGDGNGAATANLLGIYLSASGTLTIKEKGTTYTPSSPISVKRSFYQSDNITISNISTDRKTFDVPAGKGQYFAQGDTVNLLGNEIGLHQSTISAISTDTITLANAVPSGSITDVKLTRQEVYRFLIQQKATGYLYQIQGGAYGSLNSGVYQTIYETSTDATEFLYPVVAAPKDATCILDIEDTFVNPSGGVTFVRDGKNLLVAPETEGQNFDFPVLIRAADPRKNPPLFRYRPPREIVSVADNTATTTVIPLSESDYGKVLIGDRLLVNKKETFITNKLTSPYRIQVSPALSGAPTSGTFVYVGTTAAAEGQDGTLDYSYPIPNRRYFQDYDSVNQYGLSEDEPIIDASLKTNDDVQARWEAFKEAKANPKIVGSVTFEFSPYLDV